MNQITKLTGTAAEAPWVEHHPVVGAVPVQPTPGAVGVMQLSSTGLTLRIGPRSVGVPVAELLALLVPNLGAAPAVMAQAAGPSAAASPRDRVRAALRRNMAGEAAPAATTPEARVTGALKQNLHQD
jgi:hypothetical protein